jgi:cytoskeletal protein RodZ
MSNLGNLLKSRREELNVELAQVAKTLRINLKYLEAIENGEFKKLPSYAHCYGFVKSYLNYLKLDEKEVMDLFHQECPKSLFMPPKMDEEKKVFNEVNRDTNSHLIKKRVLIYSSISLFFLIIGILYITFTHKEIPVDNSPILIPKISDNTSNQPPDNNSTTSSTDNSILDNSAILQQLSDNNAKIDNNTDNKTELRRIKLSFYNTCWVNVKIDNKTELDFIAKPGITKEFSFKDFFIIDIGDASAISINFNNQVIGGLGKPKESIKNLYFTVNDNKLIYTKK